MQGVLLMVTSSGKWLSAYRARGYVFMATCLTDSIKTLRLNIRDGDKNKLVYCRESGL
jgi:hypothetical protein